MRFVFICLTIFLGITVGITSAIFLPIHSADILSPIGIKSSEKPIIIGFQPYWLLDQNADYSDKITDYTYYGLPIETGGTIKKLTSPTQETPGWTYLRKGSLNEIVDKLKNKNVQRTLLVYTSNTENVFDMINNPQQSAKTLVSDAAPIMREYGFTNLNLDMEIYATASDESRMKFTQFVKEVKINMNKEKLGTLSLEIITSSLYRKNIYDLYELGKVTDYLIFMMYDFHYPGSLVSGAVAPVGGGGRIRDFDVESSLKDALKIIPAKKIILAVPTYGYEWETLSDSPASPTIPGSGVTASAKRIENLLKDCKNCITGRESMTHSPYVIYLDKSGYYHQIFYEDKESIQQKVDLAKQYQIGGMAIWALGYEDTHLLDPFVKYKN